MLLHPLMLAWVGGAAVPLILHFLSRSRYRAVPWGAMMFLTGSNSGSHLGARAKQIILLFLRMGTVGLLAVALSRPVIASHYSTIPTAGLTTGGPAAVVIILDDSASMGYTKDGKSRLDQAREITLQILSGLKRGDQAALLLAGSRDNQSANPPSTDLQSIASRVADLQPDIGQADFAYEINRAADLLEHAAPADGEIYLICDAQSLSWRNVTDTFKQRWKPRHPGAPIPPVTVIPVGGNESDNIAVDAIEIPDHLMIRDQPSMVQVRVHNYGSTAQPSVALSVWTGARTVGDVTIYLPPHAIKTINFSARFGEPGSRVLSAAVKSTGLTTDDRLDASIEVADPLKILMVGNAADSPTSRPATEPIVLTGQNHRNGELAIVTTVSASDWPKESLKKFDVVIFSDVPGFTSDQQIALRQFSSTGGGILFLLGDHVDTDSYNKTLYNNAHGILPALLHPVFSKPARIVNANHQHPIFRFLPARPDPLAALSFNRFFPTVQNAPDAHVLARLTSGDPWIIESNIDHGRILLMTAFVDPDLRTVLMQSIVRFLGGGKAPDRNLFPGEPILAIVNEPVEERSATVQFAAGGPREPAVVIPSVDRVEIRYSKTGKPGTYRLRYRTGGKEKLVNYVVAAPRVDSDLTSLTVEQWQTLSKRIGFHRVDLATTTVAEAMNIQRGGREIWIDLVGALLVLMTAEMLLSRLWSN